MLSPGDSVRIELSCRTPILVSGGLLGGYGGGNTSPSCTGIEIWTLLLTKVNSSSHLLPYG